MEELNHQFQSADSIRADDGRRGGSWVRVLVAAFVIVLALSIAATCYIEPISQLFGFDDKEQIFIPDTFAGTYTTKLITGENIGRYTAVVEEYAVDSYRIEVLTEYGKSIYTFKLMPDGTVDSPELGTGAVSYNEDIKKLTIEFLGGSQKCEFSRLQ